MMKSCSLCGTEMSERYNYCYQCGEFVGATGSLQAEVDSESSLEQGRQEWVIHYGCLTLIVAWTLFGIWFCVNMNR